MRQHTTSDVSSAIPHPPGNKRLATPKQAARLYPAFTEGAIRDLIFKADARKNSRGEMVSGNGLAPAILRIGRKVLIDLDVFESWLDSHRTGTEGAP